MAAEVVPEYLQEVVPEERWVRISALTDMQRHSRQLTISWTVSQKDESEVGVDDDVSVPLLHLPYASAVRKRELSMTSKAPEDRDDMLRGLVSLIYDDYSPEAYRSEERRVCVLDDAVL